MRPRKPRELRPRKSPTQARSRATVQSILEAATRVFTREGYAAGTTNRIAEVAGVSIGSLYEYFPNKEALLVALMEAHVAEAAPLLAQAANAALRPDLPLRDSVGILVRAMIELHARDRAMHRVLFEEAPRPPRVRAQVEAVERMMVAAITGFLARHLATRVPDAGRAAQVLVHAIEGLTHQWVLHGDGADEDAWVEELVVLCVAYLTAQR